jgi:hypothetical protein
MPGKPAPEVKKLNYFAGTWTTDGTIGQGPWGMGGKFSWAETTEWMSGKFFIAGDVDFKMPPEMGGDGKETWIMGYDTHQNVYTRDGFDSKGRHDVSKGTVSNDTWIWTSQGNYGGQEIKQKMTMKILSPTSYSMKFEVSTDGTTWMTFMEGKATKK